MRYWTIQNRTVKDDGDYAEILLYGDIGEGFFSEGIEAKAFAEELRDKCKHTKTMDIRINSAGGSVVEGNAIYNTLARHPANKTVYIDGLAASIASVIAMAGDKILMPGNAIMMIHDPFALIVGDSEDMRKMADALDKIKEGMITAYMKKTKLSKAEISNLMTDETWFTAEEAVEFGFADELIDYVKMAAHFDLSKFKKVPANLFNQSHRSGLDKIETKENSTIKIEGGRKMEKCPVCGATLEAGRCLSCESKQAERMRAHEILSIGDRFQLRDEAMKAVQEGKSIEEFRVFALKELEKKLPNIPFLNKQAIDQDGRIIQPKLFKSFGEQMVAIINAGWPGGTVDPRLQILNATGLGTQTGPEGGYMVQTEFSTALLERMAKAAVLVPKTWHVPIGVNADGVEFPYIEEVSRATGSRWGGVRVYRRGEADTVTASKPKFGMLELRLEDLMGLCYVTNRMLKDAPSTGAIVTRAFEDEMSFRCDDEIVSGTGAGQAMGILKTAALVTVAKESGQPAATIQYENLVKMFARMPARNRLRAEWYYNQEIEPQLFTMGLTLGTGGAPVFLPPGGASDSPYASLFGRPMVPIEQASALGTVGDIIFADLNDYCWIEKGGIEAEQSIHVRFIYDEMTLRFIVRNNGAPIWKTSLTPYKGSNAISPFVALATRS